MSNWFFAANGQQQGPYPEAQFRDLIANGDYEFTVDGALYMAA